METCMIDLHIHSTISDGTDTPAAILVRAKEAGLTHFALTDHDAIEGCASILRLLQEGDPAFICGVEFSCEDEHGKYHILGYGYDLGATSIQNLSKACHDYRINKIQKLLDWLRAEHGIVFDQGALNALFSLSNPGKPHIVNMLVQYGFSPNKGEAFGLLNQFVAQEKRIRPEVAIEGILQANGIPVLAHPAYGGGDDFIVGKEMEQRITRLMGYGLTGIEAFYSGFSLALQNELLSLADRYGLYVTAGSDYHGTNKLVQLGDTNLSRTSVYPQGLQRFLQNVAKH